MPVSIRAPYSAASLSYSAPGSRHPQSRLTASKWWPAAGHRSRSMPRRCLRPRRISSTSPTAPTRRPGGRGKRRGPPPRRWRAPRRHTTPRFFMAAGGTSRVADRCPVPWHVHGRGPGVNPQLQLNWILLDFGRRSSSVERRARELFRPISRSTANCRKSPSLSHGTTSASTPAGRA